jgi:hypothetical protein
MSKWPSFIKLRILILNMRKNVHAYKQKYFNETYEVYMCTFIHALLVVYNCGCGKWLPHNTDLLQEVPSLYGRHVISPLNSDWLVIYTPVNFIK